VTHYFDVSANRETDENIRDRLQNKILLILISSAVFSHSTCCRCGRFQRVNFPQTGLDTGTVLRDTILRVGGRVKAAIDL